MYPLVKGMSVCCCATVFQEKIGTSIVIIDFLLSIYN